MNGHVQPSRSEPLFWSLFSGGGVAAALAGPALIIVFGLMGPLGMLPVGTLSADRLAALTRPALVRLALFLLAALTFFHWAHRFRFAVYDLGLKAGRGPVAVLCYGAAVAGTLWSADILLALG